MASLFDDLPDDNWNLERGEWLRDRAFGWLKNARRALYRRLQREFLLHLLEHGPNTSDPLRRLVPIPAGIDPRVVGPAVRLLASDHGLTRIVCPGKSCRPVAHRRHLEVWEIVCPAKARAWLMASAPDAMSIWKKATCSSIDLA